MTSGRVRADVSGRMGKYLPSNLAELEQICQEECLGEWAVRGPNATEDTKKVGSSFKDSFRYACCWRISFKMGDAIIHD